MLTVSTKGDYGILFLAGLAEATDGQKFVPLRKVAERKHLPVHYLAQLTDALKGAGLVRSKEGVNGGYRLEKDPKDIRVGEVVRLLEGALTLTRCTAEGHLAPCPIESTCTIRSKWFSVKAHIMSVMDEYSLADFIIQPKSSI